MAPESNPGFELAFTCLKYVQERGTCTTPYESLKRFNSLSEFGINFVKPRGFRHLCGAKYKKSAEKRWQSETKHQKRPKNEAQNNPSAQRKKIRSYRRI